MELPPQIRETLRRLPDRPGCYLMRDARGQIIYVGKAVSLRRRVQSYFRAATFRSANPKLRGLVRSVADLEFIVVRNEAEAVLTEGRLIKDFRPRYNVSFRDDKRFLLLRADLSEPLPVLRLCRIRKDDGASYFGPYASSAAARATLDFVEKAYGLRKCKPREPDAGTYRHCINDIVRYCSAPCVGRVSPEAYRARLDEAGAFLRGERPQALSALRQQMEAAAAAQDFERAAALRDTLLMLHATVRQNARVAPTPAMRREDAAAGLDELRERLALAAPPALIEAFDLSNISGTHAVGSMVCAVDGLPARNRYRRFRIRGAAGGDDPAMMAEVVRRRYGGTLSGYALPDLILVDGGAAQLTAARIELGLLGHASVPVVGLAKRFEDLYVPGRSEPLRLPRDSRALKVLQRLRDEAHRFALTYHRQLRSRRLRESRLDGIEGIGDARKRLLLERFGSVRRLAAAPVERIAAVAGIGPALAGRIREALCGDKVAGGGPVMPQKG